jgi:transcriptional regulator with XRE-family HTH domain
MRSRLSSAREQLGWSQTRLLSELERRGRATGFMVMARSSLKTALSRWENGHVIPDRHYRKLFREIFGLTDAELGFVTEPTLNADLAEADLELRGRIAAAARVDGSMVEILQAQTDNIRRLDRRLGAPVLLDQMTAHISTLRQLLSHAVLDCTRQPIAATLADAAALAGWQALDVGAIGRAWQCYEIATEAGEISGRPELLAHARGEQAYALLELRQPIEALQLVREARHDAGSAIPARMTSWLSAAEAELAAAAGLDMDARHALDQAAAVLPAGSSDDPELPYVSLDEHHLSRWRGSALARLGDHEAIEHLAKALAVMPPEYIRAKSGLLIDLAQALTAADAPDAAAEHLQVAGTLVTQIGSVRQRRRLKNLAA